MINSVNVYTACEKKRVIFENLIHAKLIMQLLQMWMISADVIKNTHLPLKM